MILETIQLLLESIAVGFVVAAPVGPIALLCINRTLRNGNDSGFATGLGAALADAIYGSIGAFGISAIFTLLAEHRLLVRLIGGAVLLVIGVQTLLSQPHSAEKPIVAQAMWKDLLSALILTLSNPLSIFAFVAALAVFSIEPSNFRHYNPLLVVIGIFSGSLLWWSTLSYIVNHFKKTMTADKLQRVHIVSGLLILTFAIVLIVGTIYKYAIIR